MENGTAPTPIRLCITIVGALDGTMISSFQTQAKTTSISPPSFASMWAGPGQRKALSVGVSDLEEGGMVPPTVHKALRTPGRPLDPSTRGFMENRFGLDFSRVRVHMDARAAASAQDVSARAYTAGSDIVFGAGQFRPGTMAGRRLLAHELAHVVQQAGQVAPTILQRDNVTGHPLLHQCASWREGSRLPDILVTAQRLAIQAVQGLQSVVGRWGNEPQTPLDRATVMGLRYGFNMEPDKTAWPIIGIDPAETRRIDQRDRVAAQTILGNFRLIARDVANYQGAPACRRRLVGGSPCLGCADDAYPRCTRGAHAFVVPQMIGQPSSPVLFCRAFFQGSREEVAEKFLHEMAHLQTFAARDKVGDIRYYGCPVAPIDPGGRGLRNPNEFMGIADSYRCFLQTLRTHKTLYERRARAEQEAERAVRSVTPP